MTSSLSPTISIIVPVHNGGEPFLDCLSSLRQAAPPPHEIIVVADGESDGRWRAAENYGFRVIRLPVKGGPARARNHGARAAEGEILLFIDSDVVVPSDIVGRIRAIFTHNADLSAVIGSYDDEPGAMNFLSQFKNLLHHYVHQNGSEEGFTFWGACGAIRRQAFLALGGFDEGYRDPSIEDIELGYRLKREGHNIRLIKELQVKHLKRWGIGSLLRSDFFHRALPWTALILRHRRLPNDLNLQRLQRLSAFLACAVAASLLAAWWIPAALAGAVLLALPLVAINASLYLFFYRKRGLTFTLGAILWHGFYLIYSALAFAVGTLGFLLNRGLFHTANRSKAMSPARKS